MVLALLSRSIQALSPTDGNAVHYSDIRYVQNVSKLNNILHTTVRPPRTSAPYPGMERGVGAGSRSGVVFSQLGRGSTDAEGGEDKLLSSPLM